MEEEEEIRSLMKRHQAVSGGGEELLASEEEDSALDHGSRLARRERRAVRFQKPSAILGRAERRRLRQERLERSRIVIGDASGTLMSRMKIKSNRSLAFEVGKGRREWAQVRWPPMAQTALREPQ